MALIPYQLPLGAENTGSGTPQPMPVGPTGWPFPVQASTQQFPALPPPTGLAPTSGPGYPTVPTGPVIPANAREAPGNVPPPEVGGPPRLQAGGGIRSAMARFGVANANMPGAPAEPPGPPGPPSYADLAQQSVDAQSAASKTAAATANAQEMARQRALFYQQAGDLSGGLNLSSLFNQQPQAVAQPVVTPTPRLPGAPIALSQRLS